MNQSVPQEIPPTEDETVGQSIHDIIWGQLTPEDRVEAIYYHWETPDSWLDHKEGLPALATARQNPPGRWEQIKSRYKTIGGYPPNLEQAVDRWIAQHTDATPKGNPWLRAIPVGEFLAANEEEPVFAARDLLMPGAITIVAAPRASGKSFVALFLGAALATGGVFRGEHVEQKRVLLIDRDNPTYLVKKRLKLLGIDKDASLSVLPRDNAPSLTDRAAWQQFPTGQYDVLILDSLGALTEGVSEKEGRQTQEVLATLKDLAARGLAILVLDNTNKAAENFRGRGEKADAVDILYECRSVTGWVPPHGDLWWERLPDYSERGWAQRASRRKDQPVMRLAFIPSKFRLGVEPEPFVLEVDTRRTPWTLADITESFVQEGELAAQDHALTERRKLENAAVSLANVVREQGGCLLKSEARTLLQGFGLSKRQARALLEDGFNRDLHPEGLWTLRPIPGERGNAVGVYLVNANSGGQNNGDTESLVIPTKLELPILATRINTGGQNTDSLECNDIAISKTSYFGHLIDIGWPKSESEITSVHAGENDVNFDSSEIGIQNSVSEDWMCSICGGSRFWEGAAGLPVCEQCHPGRLFDDEE